MDRVVRGRAGVRVFVDAEGTVDRVTRVAELPIRVAGVRDERAVDEESPARDRHDPRSGSEVRLPLDLTFDELGRFRNVDEPLGLLEVFERDRTLGEITIGFGAGDIERRADELDRLLLERLNDPLLVRGPMYLAVFGAAVRDEADGVRLILDDDPLDRLNELVDDRGEYRDLELLLDEVLGRR